MHADSQAISCTDARRCTNATRYREEMTTETTKGMVVRPHPTRLAEALERVGNFSQVAKAIGVHPSTVSRWRLSSSTAAPQIAKTDTAIRLVVQLKIGLGWLFGLERDAGYLASLAHDVRAAVGDDAARVLEAISALPVDVRAVAVGRCVEVCAQERARAAPTRPIDTPTDLRIGEGLQIPSAAAGSDLATDERARSRRERDRSATAAAPLAPRIGSPPAAPPPRRR